MFPIAELIARKTGVRFGPATPESLEQLTALGCPADMAAFYALHEPSECAELSGIRLWPIADIMGENTELLPGADLCQRGYVVFATTEFGNAFCLDLSPTSHRRESPTVVVMSHELDWETATDDDIVALGKEVSSSFTDFLERFLAGTIDGEPYTQPPSNAPAG